LTPSVTLAQTAQKTPLSTVPILLRASLLLWERGADRIENAESRVVAMLFTSSGRFFWLHIPYFEQICHNIHDLHFMRESFVR
jgi:hypothetical protein